MSDSPPDLPEVLRRFGGDRDLLAELVKMFVQESELYGQALETALAEASAPNIRREAHTIKGLLATLADAKGQAMAAALERRVGDDDVSELEPAVRALQVRLREVTDFLRQEFELP